MHRQRNFKIILLVFLLFGSLNAREVKKVAQTAMKWLSIPVGARAIAMGNAYYAMSKGADAVFWNPAGVGFMESNQLSFSYLPWIADINQNSLALVFSLGRYGTLMGSLRHIDFGVQKGTKIANNAAGWEYTEEFSPSAYQLGLGFSQRITDRFAYGMHLSYAREDLGDVSSAPYIVTGDSITTTSAELGLFNFDFGVIYYTGFHDLRLAMTLKNFSEEEGYGNVGNPIPMDWRFGMAMNLFSLVSGIDDTHKLTLTWDLSHPRDYSERFHFGVEYVFADLAALRMGYKTNYDEENISFGAGLLPRLIGNIKIGLDYAYLPFGEYFSSVQVFSLSLNF